MTRRHFLYGSVAALACLTGLGTAWLDAQHPGEEAPAPDGSGKGPMSEGLLEDVAASFWPLSFQTPDGKTLAMSSFRGKWLLVNFWATWCPPCVEELPLLDYFYQENRDKNWQLIGLAVDQPGAVRNWLQTRPLNFPVGMVGLDGTRLSKTLGNTAGSLPFSVLFGPQGNLLERKVGKLLPEELGAWGRHK